VARDGGDIDDDAPSGGGELAAEVVPAVRFARVIAQSDVDGLLLHEWLESCFKPYDILSVPVVDDEGDVTTVQLLRILELARKIVLVPTVFMPQVHTKPRCVNAVQLEYNPLEVAWPFVDNVGITC